MEILVVIIWTLSGLIMGYAQHKMTDYLKKEKIDYDSFWRGAEVRAYYKATKKSGEVGYWYKLGLLATTVMAIDTIVLAVYEIFVKGGLTWNAIKEVL
jgi:hypothetical protein